MSAVRNVIQNLVKFSEKEVLEKELRSIDPTFLDSDTRFYCANVASQFGKEDLAKLFLLPLNEW